MIKLRNCIVTISLLLLVALLPGFSNSLSVKAQEYIITEDHAATIKEHKLIAENDEYQLYLYEDTLSIIVRDKKTGAIMESTVSEDDGKSNASWKNFMQSGIVLEVIDNVSTQLTRASLLDGAKVDVQLTDNGFTADVSYEKYGFTYQVKVALLDNGFSVEIPDESITETNDQYKIGNIYVYPFMGNTHLGDRDGYMLIPDGNGAIINLEDNGGKYTSGFSQRVYGENVGFNESHVLSLFWGEFQTVNDAEMIMAPVFGMVHTDSKMAYLGIIEEGEYDASIEAYPNGAYTNYNWITSKFRLRQVYVQPTSKSGGSVPKVEENRTHSNIKVRFAFTRKEDADYSGLAKSYRNYLLEKQALIKQEDDFKIRLDFLGSDIKKWFIFNVSVPMTTTKQVKTILEDLQEENVTDILAIYKGWQKGGINTLPITKYKADWKLGGTKKLTSLIKDAKEMGIDFYLYQDALRANPSTSNTTYNVVKRIDKRLFEEETYKDVFEKMVYLTPKRTAENLKKLLKSYTEKSVDHIALAGVTNKLFSYTYSGSTYSRVDTANVYNELLNTMSESTDLILDEPFAYLWKYAGALYNIPVGSSDYIFADEDVPFLSIVLKGIMPLYGDYTNFEADKNEYFLKLVETGISPSFYITYEDTSKLLYTNSCDIYSAKYSVYKNEIIEYYTK
ncbi:MAG TPA: hypothetical protein DCE48_06000, partial [Lachnospiraceae bacterium]|nr:hypothetical protein [Lachnospiraceae bacterium]